MPINISRKTIFGEYGCEFVDIVTCDLDDSQKSTALTVLSQYEAPLPPQEIIKLIARLQMIAPEKTKSDYDIKARTAIFVEELSKYPADVVVIVMKDRYKWFPTLAEIIEKCENEVAFRKLLKRGIRVNRR